MSAAVPFDTHATIKQLAAAGMPEPQAEVLVQALIGLTLERLATKDDLRALAAELRTEMQALRADVQRELRAQMLWFFTMLVGVVGVASAIIATSALGVLMKLL